MALVTSSLVSRTAMSSSTGISQARMAARTWPRASTAAAGLAVSRTRQTCSSVGGVGAMAFIGIPVGRGAGRFAEMLGTSCKKIVLQLALQDIGQLTDFGSTGYAGQPGQPRTMVITVHAPRWIRSPWRSGTT